MFRLLGFNILSILFFCLFLACESEYTSTVKKELESGKEYNELIFGMEMGQTQKDFFETCWRLNKEEKISHGPDNKYALFKTNLDSTAEQSQKVEMLFYGIFDSLHVMRGMDFKFKYIGWAIWNEQYHAEPLAIALTDYFIKKYGGNPFLEVEVAAIEKKVFVKVDGNRQIKIYPIDNKQVRVKIEDLRYLPGYQDLVKES